MAATAAAPVERPVRLDSPFVTMAIDGRPVRLRVDPAAPARDTDEIVVTARGRSRDLRRDTLSLGADALAGCSSIVFDRRASVVRLTCG